MSVLVRIAAPSGTIAWGVLVADTAAMPEWQVRVTEVPKTTAFCAGDLVVVDGRGAKANTAGPFAFIRVAARGGNQPSLRVKHRLSDAVGLDGWLASLEQQGWSTLDDEQGVVWLSAPTGIDAKAVLAAHDWIEAVDAPAPSTGEGK